MREKPEEKRWTAINVCWKLFVKSKIIILAQTLLLFSHELILYFKQQQQPNNNNNNKKLRLRLHSCVKWCIFFCNAFTGTEPKIYKSYNRRNEWTKKNTTNNIHTEIEKRNNPINNRRFLFIEKSTAIHWIACCSLHCYLFVFVVHVRYSSLLNVSCAFCAHKHYTVDSIEYEHNFTRENALTLISLNFCSSFTFNSFFSFFISLGDRSFTKWISINANMSWLLSQPIDALFLSQIFAVVWISLIHDQLNGFDENCQYTLSHTLFSFQQLNWF